MAMNLKVKLLDQSVHDVQVDATTVISDLKCLLEALLNVPTGRQRLIYRGRVLRDENTLQEAGVEDGNTIHLVERLPDAPETGAQGMPQTSGLPPDFNRLLQGVFSALGGGGPAAAGAAPQQQQQQQAPPPHLLQSIADFLQQLSSSPAGSQFPVMPVTSLAPGLPPADAGGQQFQRSLVAALQHILAGQRLTAEQHAALRQAAAAGSGQPSLQLVFAALSVLLTQAQAYLSSTLTAQLGSSAQQLADAAAQQGAAAAQQPVLSQLSGQLQAAAALLVELARAASAASLAAQGNPIALTSNMAAVLREGSAGGLEPAWPTLYPQTSLGASARPAGSGNRSTPAAAGGAPPTGQQIAEMVASALSSSLAPVIQQVSSEVAGAVRAHREQVASGQFEAATAAATAAATGHVSSTVARVLGHVTEAINTNVRGIEQRLQRVEREAGREANAFDIATAVQQVLLPNMQPLGDVLGAAARAAASSGAAATAAAQAAQAAAAAGAQAQQAAAAAAAAAAAGAAPAATPAAAPAAAAPAAVPAAGPSSSSSSSSRQQPRGLGLGLKSAGLPAKRKAAPGSAADAEGEQAAAAAGAAGASSSSAAAAAATLGVPSNLAGVNTRRQTGSSRDGSAPSSPGSLDGRRRSLTRTPTPGILRLSESGKSTPRGDLNPVDETLEDATPAEAELVAGRSSRAARGAAAAAVGGSSGAPPPPDMAALMQMMGGMFGGADGAAAAAGGGAPTAAATASMGQQQQQRSAAGAGGGGAAPGGDLSGLMQMVGGMLGGGGAGGGGGMGNLLQMAGQIASDPAMQPMFNSIASSMLGGGGAGGAGGMGGLGSLLSGILGGPPPSSMGSAGGNRGQATVVVGMDDLEHELPAAAAAEWRRVLEEDARAQAITLAQGHAALSDVYLAGAPVKKQGLLSAVSGSS